ncbi:MAG TPA: hypothetical protein VK911_16355 [Vicinamibacterales bacterium]|nr:hypothetical protein [Vicinamibacterales bacterium]
MRFIAASSARLMAAASERRKMGRANGDGTPGRVVVKLIKGCDEESRRRVPVRRDPAHGEHGSTLRTSPVCRNCLDQRVLHYSAQTPESPKSPSQSTIRQIKKITK